MSLEGVCGTQDMVPHETKFPCFVLKAWANEPGGHFSSLNPSPPTKFSKGHWKDDYASVIYILKQKCGRRLLHVVGLKRHLDLA